MTRIHDVGLILRRPAVVIDVQHGQPHWRANEIAMIAAQHPGDHRLVLKVGQHHLTYGDLWNVEPSRELVAGLEEFGSVQVLEAAA